MIFNKEISESLTLKIAESVRVKKERGEEVFSLGIGEPDFDAPQELKDAVVKALDIPVKFKLTVKLALRNLCRPDRRPGRCSD